MRRVGTPVLQARAEPTSLITKSAKRGVAYDLASPADLAVLSQVQAGGTTGLRGPTPLSRRLCHALFMDFYQCSGMEIQRPDIVTYLKANPTIKYMLVLNEPNLVSRPT